MSMVVTDEEGDPDISVRVYLESELQEAIAEDDEIREGILLKQIADLDDDLARMVEPPPPKRCGLCNDHPKVSIRPRDCPECGNPIDKFAQPIKHPNYYKVEVPHG